MSGILLHFTLEADSGSAPLDAAIDRAVIAGWTGRDQAALEHHIKELEALGVARPASTPIYYRVAASRFTTVGLIEATGGESSGEVEYALLRQGGRIYVGVGSDHTDRKVETYGVTVSKQMCEKPLAPVLWALDEVEDHWDQLMTRSWIVENGARALYQEGTLGAMLPPRVLMAGYGDGALPDGTIMLCGTHAAKGGIRPSPRLEFELQDPVLGRAIRHAYDIETLPVLG